MKLLEDKQDVEELIDYFTNKVAELRRKELLSEEMKNDLKEMYNEVINPWYKNYVLLNKDLSLEDEEYMTNMLLETITNLNNIK